MPSPLSDPLDYATPRRPRRRRPSWVRVVIALTGGAVTWLLLTSLVVTATFSFHKTATEAFLSWVAFVAIPAVFAVLVMWCVLRFRGGMRG